MGLRGPKKPTLIKALEGNRGKRTLNELEPQPEGIAECPESLRPGARIVWERITSSLPAELYARCDESILAAFCEAAATFYAASEALAKEENQLLIYTKSDTKRHPLILVQQQASLTMAKLSRALGLSPCDRAMLKLPAKKSSSKWTGLIAS